MHSYQRGYEGSASFSCMNHIYPDLVLIPAAGLVKMHLVGLRNQYNIKTLARCKIKTTKVPESLLATVTRGGVCKQNSENKKSTSNIHVVN